METSISDVEWQGLTYPDVEFRVGGHRPKELSGPWRLWLLKLYRSGDFSQRGVWLPNCPSAARRSAMLRSSGQVGAPHHGG